MKFIKYWAGIFAFFLCCSFSEHFLLKNKETFMVMYFKLIQDCIYCKPVMDNFIISKPLHPIPIPETSITLSSYNCSTGTF